MTLRLRAWICIGSAIFALLLVSGSLSGAAALAQQVYARSAGPLLQVENDSPTALGTPTTFTAFLTGTLTGTLPLTSSQPITFSWDFGDGDLGLGAVVSHTFPSVGAYTSVVTVLGISPVLTATSPVLIAVPLSGLSAASNSPGWSSLPLTFSASISEGSPVAFAWDFGDSTLGEGPLLQHTYRWAGAYTVVVTASNPLNQITATLPVQVLDRLFFPAVMRWWPPVPHQPSLQPVENYDGDGDFNVTWSPSPSISVTLYTLQESDTPDFSAHISQVCSTGGLSCPVSGHASGWFYFRVRGENTWGTGPWSEPLQVYVNFDIVPNDPDFSSQWGLQRINVPGAWGLSTGSGIVVAVIDTGVDLDHPDLASRIWVNPREIPNNGYDDDSNGLIDDINGWDFTQNDNQPLDDNGHGTHVAGIAAATAQNGVGGAGVGWGARLVVYKVLDYQGRGYVSDVVMAIYQAARSGAQVINLSLGSPNMDEAVLNATDYAYQAGVLVVAAAGNCGDENYIYNGCNAQNPVFYPAANPHVFGVAASTPNDQRASFSETGFFVDIAAPGANIYSTFWDNTYRWLNGTSMASPFVTGLAALVWGRNPSLRNDQVAQIIMGTATDLGLPGRDDQFGYGLINAKAAVSQAYNPDAYRWAQEGTPPQPAQPVEMGFRPGVLLVKLRPGGLSLREQRELWEVYGVREKTALGETGLLVFSVPAGHELEIARQLSAEAGILFALPDSVVTALP